MSAWRTTCLDELGTVERGRSRHRPRNAPHLYGGVHPFVQTGDIKAAGLRLYDYEQTYSDFGLEQSRLWPIGTLCITIAANIGDTAILGVPACFPDSIVGFTAFENVADPVFVKYLLDVAKQRFTAISQGTAQDNLSLDKLLSQSFSIPPLEEQRRIASILGAYDDLIEVNRRRVALLEDMARSLFEEWFVRFRFPGHEAIELVDTPDGFLPKGWRWSSFGELAVEIRDGVYPSDLPADTPYIGLEHIPRRSTTMADWGRAEDVGSLKLSFRRGDVLFGKIRPYFHKVVWAPFNGVASSDAIIYRPRESQFAAMALVVASSDGFVAASVQTSNGTKMPRANPAVLRAYRIATDNGKWACRFGTAMMPAIELASSLAAANHRLAASRDLLLPRLISGQLSVAAAERELLEVT